MGKIVSNLFGGGDAEKRLKKQERELRAVEAGQKAVRQGGRGLLAYVDDELPKSLGGVAEAFGAVTRRRIAG